MKNKIIIGVCCLLALIGLVVVVNQQSQSNEKKVAEKKVTTREINVDLKTTTLDTSAENFTYYDENTQAQIQAEIDEYQKSATSIDNMLAMINPYGTNTTGLYIYFDSKDIQKVSYTVKAEGYEDFSETLKSDKDKKNIEGQIIGLVANTSNTVVLDCYNDDDVIVDSVSFKVDAPQLKSGFMGTVPKTEAETSSELSNGLYALIGLNSTYDGYTFIMDNQGVIREEIVLEGDMSENILFYKGKMLISVNLRKFALINNLGKAETIYDTGKYEIHHDYQIDKKGNIIALVNDTDLKNVEDKIISINLETKEVKLFADFEKIMGDYMAKTSPYGPECTFKNQIGEQDWLHFNSIELINDDEMILSSRETSTIMKFSNIYKDIQIDYFIGSNNVWKNTNYSKYLLTKKGDFNYQSGQHNVRYVSDDSLKDGQYYLYFYDNNYFCVESRIDKVTPIKGASLGFVDPDAHSNYYCYLVDEKKGTFELVDNIEVPYSSIVSSALQYKGNFIINSGMQKEFYEYDKDGKLIASFKYDSEDMLLGYRVYKYSFKGFYFEK